MSEYTICPACEAVWGFNEIEFQQCDCCGYPNEGEVWPDQDDDYEEEEDYEGCCPHCGKHLSATEDEGCYVCDQRTRYINGH